MTDSGESKEARVGKAPFAVGGFAAVFYLLTTARAPQWGDGLEFAAAAASGGVAHPTGYPLLTTLLAPLMGGEGSYFRGALLCSLFAAGTAGMLVALARKLAPTDTKPLCWAPVAFGLIAAFSGPLWASSSLIEAYALNALMIASVLFLTLGADWKRALSPGRLALCGLFYGLAATNHLPSLSLGLLVVWRMAQSFGFFTEDERRPWGGALALLGVVVGLSVYALVPLRASGNPPISWGGADSWEGFRWLVGGGDYSKGQFLMERPGVPFTASTYFEFAKGRVVDTLSSLGSILLSGGGILSLLLGIAGLALLVWGGCVAFKRGLVATVCLLYGFAAQTLFIFMYNIVDFRDYYLGLWVTASPFLFLGFRALFCWVFERPGLRDDVERQSRVALLFPALVILALGSNVGEASRRLNPGAEVWIERTLDLLPENALVITHGDYDTYALWYAIHGEGKRGDLMVVATNFMRYDWYSRMLPQGDDLGRFVEAEPGDFRQMTLENHMAMIREKILEPNLGKTPVVTTNTDPNVLNELSRNYDLRLVGRMLTQEEFLEILETNPSAPPYELWEILPRSRPE